MYSSWMPQNVQKRLLLYILQQLSLFSAIDLPNLEEVSLNNIHLRDVSIDPVRLGKIPGFHLRHGRLRDVELTGGMVDGVNIKINGFNIVLAPSVDSSQSDSKSSTFLLAQSTADLARTVGYSNDTDTIPDSTQKTASIASESLESDSAKASGAPSTPSSASASESSKKPSPLGGVMSKAVEIALLRLHISVEDINITIKVDTVDVILQVERVTFDTLSGVRNIVIKGIKVYTTKPDVNSGNKSPPREQAPGASHNNERADIDESDNMEDLSSSMVFTHEEASLIYMSATSQSFLPKEEQQLEADGHAVLLFIDQAEISFEGAMPPVNTKINVNTVNFAAVPIIPTVHLVISTLTKLLRLKTHENMKLKAAKKDMRATQSSKFPEYEVFHDEVDIVESLDVGQYSEETKPEENLLFSKLRIAELAISLTSALNDDGTFSSFDNDLSVVFTNSTVKQKSDGLLFGGTEKFECISYLKQEPSIIYGFTDDEPTEGPDQRIQPKADFRFELQRVSDGLSEITLLLSKAGKLFLDANSLLKIAPFSVSLGGLVTSAQVFAEIINKFQNSKTAPDDVKPNSDSSKSLLTLQTSSFSVEVKLLDSLSLHSYSFPISFTSSRNELSIHKIMLSYSKNGVKKQLMQFPQVKLNLNSTERQSFTHPTPGQALKKVNLICSKTLSVGLITGSIEALDLGFIFSQLSVFNEVFQTLKRDDLFKVPEVSDRPFSASGKSIYTNTYSNSVYHSAQSRRINGPLKSSFSFGDSKGVAASFCMTIELVSLVIKNIFNNFGAFEAEFSEFCLYTLPSGIYGCLRSMYTNRNHEGALEPFIKNIAGLPENPMIIFKFKSGDGMRSLEVELRHFYVEYYAKWLKLFEKDVSQGHDAEKIVNVTPNTENQKESLDVRLTLSNFAVGLTPLQLPSKLYLASGKGTIDFTSNKTQCYVKSSFRDLLLFLSDDVKQSHSQSNKRYSSVHQAVQDKGFVEIGRANTCHVGVTITTDIEEMKRRNSVLGISEELPLIDAKLNSDEQKLTICADSMHTLLQTLNNLKEAVVLDDQDKFRVKVDEFTLPDDIKAEIEDILKNSSNEAEAAVPNLPTRPCNRRASEDFLIVDEYYNDTQILGDDHLDLSQLNLEDSARNSTNSINVVEGHFAEKTRTHDSIVVPFKLNVNLSKVQIYLFDGYDWKTTRKSFRRVVKDIEKRAENELLKSQLTQKREDGTFDNAAQESESEAEAEGIEEILYQSIHIASRPSERPSEIINNINSQLQSEEVRDVGNTYKDLKLSRSHVHKVMADIKNVELNVTNYTSRDPRQELTPTDMNKELVNKLEVRVDTLTVFDNVSSSTWNKLLSYMSSLGEREVGTNMLQLQLTNIRPDARLPYTEAVVAAKVLPLRMYIDQDTLDFVVRFFEFKDSRFDLPVDEIVYIQKLTLEPLKLKFDYKPKRMDFAGLRAGNHAEWANLFILDGSNLSLERAVVYGAHGFGDLGKKIGRIYGPYIQKCQITNLLSGIGPVRSIMNVGKGVKDLVSIPLKEYLNDGRLLYGLQKGTKSFAKSTSYELLRLGINLVSGLQVALETLEEYFGGEGVSGRNAKSKASKRPTKTVRVAETHRKPNLMESSQNLRALAVAKGDSNGRQRKYSMTAIDEDDDLEDEELQPSILVFDPSAKLSLTDVFSDDDEEELLYQGDDRDVPSDVTDFAPGEKLVSLYSDQPKNAKDGIKLAYKTLGRNLSSTMKRISDIKNELQDTGSVQDQLKVIAKSSPVLVIRPMIGTTEATMKALMGISNEIDSRPMRENRDKYRAKAQNDSTV